MRSQLAALAVFFLFYASAFATTLEVPDQYATIQAAMDDALAGDTVLVAPGTYDDVTHEAPGSDTTKCVVIMKSGVILRGSGSDQTIIDPLHQGRGIHCEGVSDATIIEDLGVTNAFAQVYAAGILCRDGSSPVIQRCDVSGNDDGGIICLFDSSPTIRECTINNNVAKQGGGLAIENDCSPLVTLCQINGNQSPSGGGVLVRAGSTPLFVECEIAMNEIDAPN
ncbi:MAG: hypothetical protein GF355_00930, partial [Candidatus Eisenbacteria bacterium]|nr:hypothetical protein [Candidatus Eisenbacteria bacterium]